MAKKKMDKKTLLFGQKEKRVPLAKMGDTDWKKAETAIDNYLGSDTNYNTTRAKAAVKVLAKDKKFKDAYVKIGVIDDNLVMRIKASGWPTDKIHDEILFKGFKAQRAAFEKKVGLAEQFEKLSFKGLWKVPKMITLFHNFCKEIHCEENVEFYLATGKQLNADGKEKVYKTYIGDSSPKAVNLDSSEVKQLHALAGQGQWDQMDFSSARKKLFDMMESDTFGKFKEKMAKV